MLTAPTEVRPCTKHPAKFSEPILEVLRRMVRNEARAVIGRVHDGPLVVLDPFAGVGRVHQLMSMRPPIVTVGLEIEPEWAACNLLTICADAFDWMRGHADDASPPADVIATSPTYGNRFSDHHNATDGSTRRSYTHDIGHELHPNNSGTLPWGPKYWAFHAEAYRLMLGVLRPGGLLLLNVSDFYKAEQPVHATAWHRGAAMGAGFVHAGRDQPVRTPRLKGHGAEATAARADHETILRFRRPEA